MCVVGRARERTRERKVFQVTLFISHGIDHGHLTIERNTLSSNAISSFKKGLGGRGGERREWKDIIMSLDIFVSSSLCDSLRPAEFSLAHSQVLSLSTLTHIHTHHTRTLSTTYTPARKGWSSVSEADAHASPLHKSRLDPEGASLQRWDTSRTPSWTCLVNPDVNRAVSWVCWGVIKYRRAWKCPLMLLMLMSLMMRILVPRPFFGVTQGRCTPLHSAIVHRYSKVSEIN
jgi:hypothetical protein